MEFGLGPSMVPASACGSGRPGGRLFRSAPRFDRLLTRRRRKAPEKSAATCSSFKLLEFADALASIEAGSLRACFFADYSSRGVPVGTGIVAFLPPVRACLRK